MLYVAWSITMASYALGQPCTVPLTYLGLFGFGALVMRSAGCTINDMWDRHLDKAVGEHFRFCTCRSDALLQFNFSARTRERPLARGDVTPNQALIFLGTQLIAGLGVLLQLNWYRCVRCAMRTRVYANHLIIIAFYSGHPRCP
jgi:4-hydroxybenzoate polyprenyltransferase